MKRHVYVFTVVMLLQCLHFGASKAIVPTILHVFDLRGVYCAINLTNGDLIHKKQIPLPGGDLVEMTGVVIPTSNGDDFLLIGGNITDSGRSYRPIMWSYNIENNTFYQKSFIHTEFQQYNYSWIFQMASYDPINNIVYLNGMSAQGQSWLIKFDYNQHKEDIIPLIGTGLFYQSSYNQTTNTIYLGGPNQVPNQFGQLAVVTYNTLSGEMTSQIIIFDVPDSCYYDTSMFQYNSRFFACLGCLTGHCPNFIFEVDLVANTSTLLATIPYDNSEPIDFYSNVVFDGVNGYLGMITTNIEKYTLLEICLVDLNTLESVQYAVPNPVIDIVTLSEDYLWTLS